MFKLIIRHLLIGISLGSIIVTTNVIWVDLTSRSFPLFLNYSNATVTTNTLSTIILCMAFIFGSIGYEIEKWSFRLKITVHFTIGIGTFLMLRFYHLGFIFQDLFELIVDVLFNSLMLLAVWSYYYIKDKRDIKKINQKLQEIQ